MFYLQMMIDNYKEGKEWMDKSLPLYVDKVKPYYLVAQDKAVQGMELAVLGYKKVGILAKAGVDKLEETLPGSRKQIDQFGDLTVSVGVTVLEKAKMLIISAQDTALDIIK